MWSREIPGNRIKEEASKSIGDEVKAQLSKQVAEDQAQAKSQELSRGKQKPSRTRCALGSGPRFYYLMFVGMDHPRQGRGLPIGLATG